MDRVAGPIPKHLRVHKFRRILGCTETKAVETEGELITSIFRVRVVLSAGIHLTEYQLPVVLLLVLVIVHRDSAAEILDTNALVEILCDNDFLTIALSGLVDGVGENLKKGVLTAVHSVGAKDDSRTFADPVRPLQLGDLVIGITCRFCHNFLRTNLMQIIILKYLPNPCQELPKHRPCWGHGRCRFWNKRYDQVAAGTGAAVPSSRNGSDSTTPKASSVMIFLKSSPSIFSWTPRYLASLWSWSMCSLRIPSACA